MSVIIFDPHKPKVTLLGLPDTAGATRPDEVAVGLAALAVERLRTGAAGDRLALAVGLASQASARVQQVADATIGPPARIASRARQRLAGLPGAGFLAKPVRAGQ